MTSPDSLGPRVDVNFSVQPGPDGTPWVGIHVTHGLVTFVLVVSIPMATTMAARIPEGLQAAIAKATDADDQQVSKTIQTIPANALDELTKRMQPK